jgi:hypothetical protein
VDSPQKAGNRSPVLWAEHKERDSAGRLLAINFGGYCEDFLVECDADVAEQPGIYPVLLTTTWNGSFSHNAVERAITGQIKKVSALTITVVAAPTRVMN